MADTDLERLTIDKGARGGKAARGRRPRGIFWAALALVAVLAVAAWAFFTRGVSVHVTTVNEVYPSQILAKLSASGYVVAQRKADVAAKVTGRLVSLEVGEGSAVKEGQVLATLENDDAQALVEQARANVAVARERVAEAEASLRDAQLTYGRMERLVKTGAVSRSEFDSASTRLRAAQAGHEGAKAAVKAGDAALRSALASLSYTRIRAPFDAVVLTKNADVGDIITPLGSAANAKAAVVSIADLSSLQVEADVSESNIGMVSVNQPCTISLDALPGVRFDGAVDTVVPTVDRSKATVLVKVRFEKRDPRILPEMSAKVGFLSRPLTPREKMPRVMVASPAGRRGRNGDVLFLVRGGRAKEAGVRTGEEFGGMVEVLGGAKPGDTVVADPPEHLRNGSKVTVLEK